MRVLTRGHSYVLLEYDPHKKKEAEHRQIIRFMQDGNINETLAAREGTNCQELIRVLINRVQFLDKQVRSPENDMIIMGLRTALMGFEHRAGRRKLSKGEFEPENIKPNPIDGHWEFDLNEEPLTQPMYDLEEMNKDG